MKNGDLVYWTISRTSKNPIYIIEDYNGKDCKLKIINSKVGESYACGRYTEESIKSFGMIKSCKISNWCEELK